MEGTDLESVFQRYLDNEYTEADLNLILEAIVNGDLDKTMTAAVLQRLSFDDSVDNDLVDHIADNVEQHLSRTIKPTKVRKLSWISYAAAILFFLGIGLYFYSIRSDRSDTSLQMVQDDDIPPGTDKAILTLEGGNAIDLDGKKGQIITKDGIITYADGESVTETESRQTRYTLSTPRGGQYQAILPDGTKVWLNAESSLSFPPKFSSSDRVVNMSGEIYFEVAHESNRPFKVNMNGQVITVKGTSFNVNAYPGEEVNYTTLITGKVEVLTEKGKLLQLKPGQVLSNDGLRQVIQQANTEEAIAWKDGHFLFDKKPLKEVMKQISRWYEVDVEYASDDVYFEVYGGGFSRNADLRTALNVLEVTGDVKFKIVGKKVLVYKK